MPDRTVIFERSALQVTAGDTERAGSTGFARCSAEPSVATSSRSPHPTRARYARQYRTREAFER
jgi:hypothetical protein